MRLNNFYLFICRKFKLNDYNIPYGRLSLFNKNENKQNSKNIT